MMPPRKKSPIALGAAEKATRSKRRNDPNAKEPASVENRDLATSDDLRGFICPFATFTEWASDADEAAHGDL